MAFLISALHDNVFSTNIFNTNTFWVIPSILFAIGAVGGAFNKKNLITLLLALELMLLSASLNFIYFSVVLNDVHGQLYALIVLAVAAGESAIGLGILVITFRLKQNILFSDLNSLRG